jgi:thiol:disulfide interchange protein DsbC
MSLAFRIAGLAPLLVAATAVPAEQPATTGDSEFGAVDAALRRALPSTPINSITPTPISGLVEVVAGRNVLYADTTGRWLLVGHLYDLDTATDITAARVPSAAPRIPWGDLPLDAAVRFGRGPWKLAVLSDPHCAWCRRLHRDLRGAEGLEVFEIMYPISSVHPDAGDTALKVLCQPDPPAALDAIATGGTPPDSPSAAACIEGARAHVAQALALGKRSGVQGTPTLVAPDGRTHAGYLAPGKLRAWLKGRDNATIGAG